MVVFGPTSSLSSRGRLAIAANSKSIALMSSSQRDCKLDSAAQVVVRLERSSIHNLSLSWSSDPDHARV